MIDLQNNIAKEARRIEEDTEHSAKGHFNASGRWEHYHLWIGLPAALLAAIASATAFENHPDAAGILAILSTSLTTTLTFLKPSERAENHKSVGSQYLALRNKARIFREIELADTNDLESVKKRLIELATARDELNQTALAIPRKDYEKAKQDIDSGRSTHKIDKE